MKEHAGGDMKQLTRNVGSGDMTARLLVPSSGWQEKITTVCTVE
jgi:hypothetical protein